MGKWVCGEMSEVRCGFGGLPPVVVTPFGRLGVGSIHHVDEASLAGLLVVTMAGFNICELKCILHILVQVLLDE